MGAEGKERAVSGTEGCEGGSRSPGVRGGVVDGGDEEVLVRLLELFEPGTGVNRLND
jgi:hypothetical protein